MTVPQGLAHRIRELALPLRGDARSDAALLTAFAADRDEEAFTTLVVRHRRAVWDTCRAALGNDADAEDAFQAVFIALARNAGKVRPDTLPGWLKVVALRASSNARVAARRREAAHRRLYERTVPPNDDVVPPEDDVQALVRDELAGLPERLRVPIALYYLEGKTQAEVGRILGVTDRAVAARLRRGLEALREQLACRGMVATAAALAGILGGLGSRAAEAAAPAGLVSTTTDLVRAAVDGQSPATAAVRLADGIMGIGVIGRVKLCVLVLTVVGLGAAGGVATRAGLPPAAADAVPAAPKAEIPPTESARVDRLGDPLPVGAISRIGTHRFHAGRSGGAEDVAYFPDGKTVASVHGGTEVQLWEAASGKPVRVIGGPAGARWVAVAPAGNRLAVAGVAEVWVWSLVPAAPKLLWKWRAAQVPPQPAVSALGFSPDGGVVAVGDREGKCTRLFRADTGAETGTLAGHPLAITATARGKYLAVVGGHNRDAWADQLVFWDGTAGRPARVLDAPAGEVLVDVALSPDGRALVRTAKGNVRLIDVATGAERGTWSVRDGARRGLAFLPGGKEVVELDAGRIRFRNPATGAETRPEVVIPALALHSLNINPDVTKQLSPDGACVAVPAYGEVTLWDLATGRPAGPAGQVQGGIRGLAVSPDGRAVLTIAGRGAEARVWDAKTGEPGAALTVATGDEFAGLGWGADGRPLTLCRPVKPTGPGHLLRSDPQTGAATGRVSLPTGQAWPAGQAFLAPFVVTPAGGRVATASGREIDVLEPTGAGVRRLSARATVTHLAISGDGRTLAAVTNKWRPRMPGGGPQPPEVAVELWDVATGRPRAIPTADANWDLFQVTPALSTDGRWLAVVTWDNSVTLVEVASGRPGQKFECRGRARALAFSTDGRALAAGDAEGAVTVWDLASGQVSERLTGHRGPIAALAFTLDGRRLVSGSADGTALVWDLRVSGRPGTGAAKRSEGELCDALFGVDGGAAHRAVFALAERPDRAVRLLTPRLIPPEAPPAAEVERWVTELGDARFATRESAQAALEKAGEAVGPTLRKTLAGNPSPEVRTRLERLVARLDSESNPARVAGARAVAVLERAGTPAARRALEDAARRGVSGVRAEAEAALHRMGGAVPPR